MVKYALKNIPEAIQDLKRAETLAETLDDELLRNKIYNQLAYANYRSSNSPQLLKYSQKLLDSSQACAMQRRSKEFADSLASANKASQMADWQMKFDERQMKEASDWKSRRLVVASQEDVHLRLHHRQERAPDSGSEAGNSTDRGCGHAEQPPDRGT
jgi:hypothetical protein